MSTYYKYAERDASNQVNWAEITSNMVNSLKEVEAIRQSKRQAIDDATAELGTTLSEAPQGDHRGLNEFAMTYANNAQQMRLMQDQLLKSGQLKLKDYNIGRANLTQGTTQLFNLGKKYQAIYSDRMKKFQDGTTSQLDADMLARLEGFANFSNHEAYINPTNGQVSIGKLVEKDVDGKKVVTMDKTPGNFTTVQQLNFSLSQEIPKYQMSLLDAEVAKFAKTYLKTDGSYKTLDDVRQMPEYDKMVDDIVNSQLVVPNNVGSILASYIGGYKIVFSKEEQDENSILMVEDPQQPGSGKMIVDVTSETGKKQKAKAAEYLKRHIEKQLESKETEKEPRPQREKSASKILEEQQGNVVDLWNSLYSETDTAKRNTIVSSILESAYNKQSNNALVGIDFVSRNVGTKDKPVMQDFMELRYLKPGGNRTGDNAIPITGDYESWASSGISIHGVEDKDKRQKGLNAESIFGGKDNSYVGIRAGRGDDNVSNSSKVRNQVRQFFGKSKKSKAFVKADEDKIMTKLQGALSSLGFTFETSYGLGADKVKVIAPDKTDFEFVVGSSTDNSEDLLKWLLPKITNEAADVFIESGLDISEGIIGKSETTETKDKKKLPGT